MLPHRLLACFSVEFGVQTFHAVQIGVVGPVLEHDAAVRATNMFDMSDPPLEVTFVVNEDKLRRLADRLASEQVRVVAA